MDLQRLLIDRMENRILVGLTMVLASMVLVGWVAINETGRMASFQQQHLARSVEKGAELFSSSCATCHGNSGEGSARAPGLNNPQLFGHDYLAPLDTQIAAVETRIDRCESLTANMVDEEARSQLSEEEFTAVQADLAAIIEQFGEDPLTSLNGELTTLVTNRANLILQMQSAIDRGYDPEDPSRMNNVGWGSTLETFVLTTLVSGRPVSTNYWPEPMAAWSQTAGGPLRDDQLQDLANYVLNWGHERNWTLEDLLRVQQFAKEPVEGAVQIVENPVAAEIIDIQFADVTGRRDEIDAVVARALDEMAELTGDPNNGQSLYNGSLACSACHNLATVAPPTEGTFTRVQDTRLADPNLAGYSAEHYIVESILAPNAYVVEGYPANNMPQNFGERLDAQLLADLVAYLSSQDGADPLAN